MKTLIVCKSIHHGNTEKIASVFAKVLDAQVKTPQQINSEELQDYGLIGFGSGIYFYKHHRALLELADKLPQASNGKAFIFSTSGIRVDSRVFRYARKFHNALREKLQSKGYEIIGEFNCAGLDTYSFLKYIGGINRGRPNAEDLKHAKEFARNLGQNAHSP